MGAGPGACLSLQVFNNILTKSAGPEPDPKYRRLRLQNPKISAAVVDVDGGIETLQVALDNHPVINCKLQGSC